VKVEAQTVMGGSFGLSFVFERPASAGLFYCDGSRGFHAQDSK
jgi:hypothetical protein